MNKPISSILKSQGDLKIANEDFFNYPWKDVRMQIADKNGGKPTSVLVNGSFVISSGKKQGLVLVMHNMTQIDELIDNLKKKTEESEASKQKLIENMEELKKLNDLMLGRELRIAELKKQVADLENKK
jgi:uncharacterized radical SAM superfamily Fe-S cluster-containing enzyme